MNLYVFVGQMIGGAMLAMGAWILSQATFDNVERIAVGSIVIVAGTLIVRWVLKTSERVEATWSGAVKAANERAMACEQTAETLRKENEELRVKYDRERALRISLEESGMQDRRHPPA
jgi:hypothetical protein